MKKRIAIISYHTCPLAAEEGKETGGMNVYVLHTAKELAKKGFLIDIFTRSQDPKQPKIVEIASGLRLIHVKAGPESYILPDSEENKKLFFVSLPEFVLGIKKFQNKKKITYDLYDAHYYLSGLAALQLKEGDSEIPLLMTFHTLGLMKNLIARNGLSTQEKERIKAEFRLSKESQMIVTPSKNEKKYLQYLYEASPNTIQVISPGVDTTLFRPLDKRRAKKAVGAAMDQQMILFVGRIDSVKGIDVLIYAMKILLIQNPAMNVCLWIVGGDVSQEPHLWSSELQKLEQLRKMLSLETTVKFVGQQPQHELPNYYNAAELVVMPSHYESFGMTALEAMSCGTPVITTNVTGISELLDEKCQKHITTANNPLLLSETMKELLLHHTEKTDHILRKDVAAFDWKKVSEKIEAVYKTLL